MDGLEDGINEALREASDADDFIQKVISRMSADEKKW